MSNQEDHTLKFKYMQYNLRKCNIALVGESQFHSDGVITGWEEGWRGTHLACKFSSCKRQNEYS